MSFRFYRDLDLRMILDSNTGDIVSREDDDAVKNAVKNLIMTQKGEAMFNIAKGTNLRKILFSNANQAIIIRIQKQIEFAISNYEPRVTSVNVLVSFIPERHLLTARVSFTIIGSNRSVTIQLPLDTLR